MIGMTNLSASRLALGAPALENASVSSLDKVAINPQPLPPKNAAVANAGFPADWATLNPQPLPPKNASTANATFPSGWVTLNPQPLPPKQVFEYVKSAMAASTDHTSNGANANNRGIIIVGGDNHVASPLATAGIIIVGGRSAIR